MKRFLIFTAVIITVLSHCIPCFASDVDYTVVNPYKNVKWESWQTYKANLHTHTTASDSKLTLTETVEAYYDAGYDILALTDHGVINNGWTEERETYGRFGDLHDCTPLSDDAYARITGGLDRNGRGMTDLTGGIENSMSVVSATHVNGYFSSWGTGIPGIENDYRTAAMMVEKTGGFSVLNHIGRWTKAYSDHSRSSEQSYLSYFSGILLDFRTCLGMEIVNRFDNMTGGDRVLWDNLLSICIPEGRNIWGFANDDTHNTSHIGNAFELFVMPSNTITNIKNCMTTGAFFACSKYDYTDYENPTVGNGDVPRVASITVDDESDAITVLPLAGIDCSSIEWISNGVVISRDYTLALDAVSAKLGCYVRFVLKGAGGVTYSQPFELVYEGRDSAAVFSDNAEPLFYLRLCKYLLAALIVISAAYICTIIVFVRRGRKRRR